MILIVKYEDPIFKEINGAHKEHGAQRHGLRINGPTVGHKPDWWKITMAKISEQAEVVYQNKIT
jgi:hypothetical protein